MNQIEQTKCPYCKSKNLKKQGKRKNKQETIQKYQCKECSKHFTNKQLTNKTYPAKIILKAISNYNLGYTQNKVSKIISQKYKIKTPQRTISEWINEHKNICTFARLRKQAVNEYKPNNIIFKKQLQHKQIYRFQVHEAKLKLIANELQPQKFALLKTYLQKILTKQFPHHIF